MSGDRTSQLPPSSTHRGAAGLRAEIPGHLLLMGDRCPPYRRVLELLVELLEEPATPLASSFDRAWERRSFESGYERPLLVLASLRYDALTEGPAHPLHRALGTPEARASDVTVSALQEALAPERLGFWITLRSRRVQTNEVSRAVSWLWPADLAGCSGGRRPLCVVDVGASGGLSLIADLLSLSWRRRPSGTLAAPTRLALRARAGFDPRPLDVLRADDSQWLRACVWPGESARLARLEAAIAAYRSAAPAPELTLLRASSVPARLGRFTDLVGPGGLVLVNQTVVRDYIPSAERAAYEDAMREWLERGPRGERAWTTLELEDGTDPSYGCALDVHVSTGGGAVSMRLGRTSYHPEVIEVRAEEEQRARELLAARA